MKRFHKADAAVHPEYIRIYVECDHLLDRVQHFGFADVVDTLDLHHWAPHIRWDWLREFLAQERQIGTEEIIDEVTGAATEHLFLLPPAETAIENPPRPLNPLAQVFFDEKKKQTNKVVRKALRHNTEPDVKAALIELHRHVRIKAGEYYAHGNGKKTCGFATKAYGEGEIAEYGHVLRRGKTVGQIKSYNRSCDQLGKTDEKAPSLPENLRIGVGSSHDADAEASELLTREELAKIGTV